MLASKLAGKNIEEDFRVRIGIHVTQFVAKHFVAEFPGVDQVSVVRERDSVWRIDVEGLRFRRRLAPGRGIANVPDADTAPERLHVARLEDVAHQPVGLALVDLQIAGEDARGVLPAMLQRGEGVVQVLVDVRPTDDSDDAAHCSRTRMA